MAGDGGGQNVMGTDAHNAWSGCNEAAGADEQVLQWGWVRGVKRSC